MIVIINYKDNSFAYFKANDVDDALRKADSLPSIPQIESLLIDGEKYNPRKGD